MLNGLMALIILNTNRFVRSGPKGQNKNNILCSALCSVYLFISFFFAKTSSIIKYKMHTNMCSIMDDNDIICFKTQP